MFLAKLQLLLAGNDKVIVELARKGDQLELVVIPKVANFKPDTDDAALAVLQAGLALPFRTLIPANVDADQFFAEQIAQLAEKRAAPLSQLEAYHQELTQAANASRAASDAAARKKAEENAKGKDKGKPGKAAKPGAKAVPASTLTAPANATDAADAGDEAADTDVEAGDTAVESAAAVVAPEPASGSLFADLEG